MKINDNVLKFCLYNYNRICTIYSNKLFNIHSQLSRITM